MYEELIKHLRNCDVDYYDCSKCPMMYDEQVEQDLVREHCAAYETADAIEKLALNLDKATNFNGKTSWIPATGRLPSEDGFTLIFTAHGHAGVCYFTNGWWGGYDKDGITHWMPLPTPPKEDSK